MENITFANIFMYFYYVGVAWTIYMESIDVKIVNAKKKSLKALPFISLFMMSIEL